MNDIKFLKDKRIQLDGRIWRPYCISDLPNNFGCIEYGESNGVAESYARGFQVESMEEYISVTLGFNVNNIDWQTHEELPQLVELHNQEYV